MAGSRKAIQEALLGLMREGVPFGKITVAGLCRRAGVSRTTYYRLYYAPADVLSEVLDEFFSQIDALVFPGGEPAAGCSVGGLAARAVAYQSLVRYRENADLLKMVLESEMAPLVEDRVRRIVWRSHEQSLGGGSPSATEQMLFEYRVVGMTHVTCRWLREGCQVPVEDVLEFMVARGI